MMGPGGQPPQGWQDPYGGGGSAGWSGDPYAGGYGQGGYGQGGYGYGYGPPGVPTAPTSSGSTTAALVCNIIAVMICCGVLSIPGAVTAAIAMGRVHTDPQSARTLTIWSWVLFGISIVAGIVILIVYIIAMVASSQPDYDTGGV